MSLINRTEQCAKRYKIPARMRDFLLNEARTQYRRRAAEVADGKITDDALQEEVVEAARKRVEQWQELQTQDFRKRAWHRARAQGYMDRENPKSLGEFVRRLVDLKSGRSATATASRSSMVGRENAYLSVIDDIHPHKRLLEKRESFMKIIRYRFGEIGEGDLTEAEKAAADAIDRVIEQTRVDTNAAAGVANFIRKLDGYLPQRLNSQILRRVEEDDFVAFMRDKIEDPDGYWTGNNAEGLRKMHKNLTDEDGGRVGDSVFAHEFFSRKLKYKNADAYFATMENYAGANSLLNMMTEMVARRAKRNAIAYVAGTDLRKFTNEMHEVLREGGAAEHIEAFDRGLRNIRADFNVLAAVENGKESGRNALVAAGNVVAARNIGKLGWAVLTSMQGIWRSAHLTASGQAQLGDFIMSYARLIPAVFQGIKAAHIMDSPEAQYLRAMKVLNNRRLADLYNTARATGEFAESSYNTGSWAEEATAKFKRLTQWGVLKMSAFNRVNEYVRNAGIMHDAMVLGAIMKRGTKWKDLGAQTQDWLLNTGIDAADWAITLKGVNEAGALVEDALGVRVDFSRIPSRRVAHKWMDRATNRADIISGVVSKETDAWFKGSARPGTWKRLGADAVFGLMRDPTAGAAALIESVSRPMRTQGGFGGAAQSGAVLAMYMLPTMATYYGITQIRHYSTTGEWHDWYERDPRGFLNRAVSIAALELAGPWVAQELHFIDDQKAAIGGGPAWDDALHVVAEAVDVLTLDEDKSGLLRFMSGNDKEREKALAKAFKELFPTPGILEDNVRNFYDTRRDHWSR